MVSAFTSIQQINKSHGTGFTYCMSKVLVDQFYFTKIWTYFWLRTVVILEPKHSKIPSLHIKNTIKVFFFTHFYVKPKTQYLLIQYFISLCIVLDFLNSLKCMELFKKFKITLKRCIFLRSARFNNDTRAFEISLWMYHEIYSSTSFTPL